MTSRPSSARPQNNASGLRVYTGNCDGAGEASPCNILDTTTSSVMQRRAWEGDQVRVRLVDLLPVLLQAAVDQSAWLDDFADENITISKDLHQVLAIYQDMRRGKKNAA